MKTEKTKRELAIEQIKLMDKIRFNANVNIVTCGNCGTILLVERFKEEIECFGCKLIMDDSDCPDFWYDNVENSAEFDEDEDKK